MIESAAPGRKITLVAHDWGAFAAYAMIGRRPELFERAVMFDIGLITPKLLPKLSWLVIGLYQWWLALSFVVSQVLPIVGTLVGDVMLGVFPWRLVGPCPHDAKVGIPRPWREVHSWMCYPYLHIWRDILLDLDDSVVHQIDGMVHLQMIEFTKPPYKMTTSVLPITRAIRASNSQPRAPHSHKWLKKKRGTLGDK